MGAVALGVAFALAAPSMAEASRAELPANPPVPSPFGNWQTHDGQGVIAIAPCGRAICGRIVGIVRAPDEPIPKDVHGASQCGLTIIPDAEPTGDGFWLGHVIDPRTGTIYGAKLWLDANGDLCLRGFLGLPLLGKTEVWRPFTGRLGRDCGVA